MGMLRPPWLESPALVDLGARSQTHLFPTYAYRGILLHLMIRSYLRSKKLCRQAGRQPALSSLPLGWHSLIIYPIYRGSASRCRGVVHRGYEGGRVAPLSTSPSPEFVDLVGVSTPPHFHCPFSSALISCSLSPRIGISSSEVCFTSHLVAPMRKSVFCGSPQSPPRPYAES
jgi:hypothetical protein